MEDATFETMMTQLEQLVDRLEAEGCTLEEAMALFEQGTALVRTLDRRLSEAEQKITLLDAPEESDGAAESEEQP